MSEMIERMARRAVNMHGSWDAAPPEVKDSVRATMREVLAELREPTDAMADAGRSPVFTAWPCSCSECERGARVTCAEAWREMVDEALR